MIVDSTISVDVGNSTVKIGMLDVEVSAAASGQDTATFEEIELGGRLEIFRYPLAVADWSDRLLGEVGKMAAGHDSLTWLVASVNTPASDRLRRAISFARPKDQWRLITRNDIGLAIEVRNPDLVGIDRLLGAAGAKRFAVDGSAISIDAGSAVTVDLVRDGRFLGGAIMPGIRMQLAILNQATDRLPRVDAASNLGLEIPGRDTQAAMRAGVMLGIAGGIDRLLYHYSELCGTTPGIVITGGDATSLVELIRHRCVIQEDLVLGTIARIAARGQLK
ncbi:MAG: type III pantothenate kinase [Planctomycetales bacterium]|nr:type III pantothenate kinase [Planctomycetales bacterium]